MNKVYILNKGGHDHSDAERFGTLVFITNGIIDKLNVNSMYRECDESFQVASPDDYILISSLSVFCGVACAVFARKFGRLNLLLFKDGRYVERHLLIRGPHDI